MRRAPQLLVLALVLAIGAVTPAWAAPANDTFATATPLTLPTTIGPIDTTGATNDDVDAEVAAACGVEPGARANTATVWYAFTPDEDIAVRIGTDGSSYTVAGAVVTGSPGDFTRVSCFLGGTTFLAEAGVTYHLVLADWGIGGGGTLQAQLETRPAPTLDITRARVLKRDGAVTLTGTITCPAGTRTSLSGTLSQRVGRVATIRGFFDTWPPVECDGSAQPWTATVIPFSGEFAGGKATLDYLLHFANDLGFFSRSGTVELKLRGG